MVYSNLSDPFGHRRHGNSPVMQVARKAIPRDLGWVKVMADAHRKEIGFVLLPSLVEAQAHGELLVLNGGGGFCRYHQRRDGWHTIYEIVSTVGGGGRALLEAVGRPLRLKCPVGLPANGFYAHMGGTLARVEDGRKRALNVWEWPAL